jgi:hypothetical protein
MEINHPGNLPGLAAGRVGISGEGAFDIRKEGKEAHGNRGLNRLFLERLDENV